MLLDAACVKGSWIAAASGEVLVGLTAENGELAGSCCCSVYAWLYSVCAWVLRLFACAW